MDIITHVLAATFVSKLRKTIKIVAMISLLVGSTIPDIGEIPIQNALSKKYGEKLAVYDARTSDISIAGDLKITWLYDLMHSICLATLITLTGLLLIKRFKKKLIFFIGTVLLNLGIGLFCHILLDSFNHGKVWALKLFFPFTNFRFKILSESLGSWWDLEPKFIIPFTDISLPILCLYFWVGFIILIFFYPYLRNVLTNNEITSTQNKD